MEDFTEVFVWGSDHFGQLGLGSSNHKTYCFPKFCSFNILIKSVSCGDQHSGFISSLGHLYTMGSNMEGRLGIGNVNIKFSPSPCLVETLKEHEISFISFGGGHSLAITAQGNAYTWGYGQTGALGLGNTQNQWSPVYLRLPGNLKPLQGVCGSKHTGLILHEKDNLSLYMCGNGDSGQLGTGKREKETELVKIKTPEDIIQVSCGVFHTGMVSATGNVYMTGGNSFGQLGLGNKKGTCIVRRLEGLNNIKKILCNGYSIAISENGDVYIWGTSVFGEYLTPYKISSYARDICIGGTFGLIVDENYNVYSWGNNSYGELGLGDYETKPSLTVLSSLQGKKISQVSCGNNFTIALGNDVKYNSSRHKTSTPLRQSGKTDSKSFKITLHESGKENTTDYKPDRYSTDKIGQSRSTFDKKIHEKNSNREKFLEKSLENEIIALKSTNEYLLNEISNFKDENRRLHDNVLDSKKYIQDIEDLRRNNESLKEQHDLANQSLQLEVHRLRTLLEDAQHKAHALEIESRSYREEASALQELVSRQGQEFFNELQNKLDAQAAKLKDSHNKEIFSYQNQLEQAKVQIKQAENNLNLTNTHKNRLEEALNTSNSQVKTLSAQLDELSSRFSRLEDEKSHLAKEHESLWAETELFKKEATEKEGERDQMIKIIEEKMQEIENDRSKLVKERDMLNSVVNDLSYELNRSNQLINEHNQTISDLQTQLLNESESQARLLIDLNSAKEEIVTLESKNNEIFENLQKELSIRAKEYKERTLNILNTPSRSIQRTFLHDTYDKSPSESFTKSPIRENEPSITVMPSIELINKTPRRSASLQKSQQDRVNAAALRLMQRQESPLKNIRVSSPTRKSPDRPSPYRKQTRSTPETKPRIQYV